MHVPGMRVQGMALKETHVTKTVCALNPDKRTVVVAIECNICGRKELPEISLDHADEFGTLLKEVARQTSSPRFFYAQAHRDPITNLEEFDTALIKVS